MEFLKTAFGLIVPWLAFALVLVLILVFAPVLVVGEAVKFAMRIWREQ